MTEQCQKCKREEQRYIILEIVEFDVGGSAAEGEGEEEDVTEISSCDGVTLCRTCWIEIKKNSSTLSEMIKYV
jgi:hypothetical protein